MTTDEVNAKTILRKHDKIDSWFVSHYGMNFYRGCSHNCVYCDGRSEGYYVKGEFGEDVHVKANAIEILRKELDPKGKRAPLKRSYMMLGGGVGDSYQPAEAKYKLTRKALNLMYERNFPVHILTKSTLVKRDADILKKINGMSRAIVSFSLSSASEKSTIFEPGVPHPRDRLDAIRFFRGEGIHSGVFLMPVIPFVTDTPDMVENTVRMAKDVGVEFIIFGGMTLKDGKQKDYFMETLKSKYPELVEQYHMIYPGNKWGSATSEYYRLINRRFHLIAKKHRVPTRIPPSLYSDILSPNDLAIVVLEQMDYLLKMEGLHSPYSRAPYAISRMDEPITKMKFKLRTIKGVNAEVENVLKELLETGKCAYLEELLNFSGQSGS